MVSNSPDPVPGSGSSITTPAVPDGAATRPVLPSTNGTGTEHAKPAAQKKEETPVYEVKDGRREVVETIVFVVVLVLMLKSFVAEAFVIPTGSMAETLWGYQRVVQCPRCEFRFPVNNSSEDDIHSGRPAHMIQPVTGCTCPNCMHSIDFEEATRANPNWPQPSRHSGDRVLVGKFIYDTGLNAPERYDVVVFKYPKKPQEQQVPTNYIKRLIGFGGETLAIHQGNLYVLDGLKYDDRNVPQYDLWREQFMHEDDPQALDLFEKGRFHVLRKPPAQMLALRRIVYDNDYQNKDHPLRWRGEKGWTPDNPAVPRRFTISGTDKGMADLRYQHLVPHGREPIGPSLITDFMGYNTYVVGGRSMGRQHWVGDLMVEMDVTVEQPAGELRLELNKGGDRFQARFDLSSGTCTLVRVNSSGEKNLESKPTNLKGKGTWRVRFANFDERLTVWVDGQLPFAEGVSYLPAPRSGPTGGDLQPVTVSAQGATLSVTHLKVFRDTFYTLKVHDGASSQVDFADPTTWDSLNQLRAQTFYVQPGHYLCLGDNSPESSDSRAWGTVPERLLLGRALMIYYPFWPAAPLNRAGVIR